MKNFLLSFLLLPIVLVGCNPDQPSSNSMQLTNEHNELIAVIHPTEGNEANGTITFTRVDNGVRVQATIAGLDPESRRGFHIHEFGDCSAADATSAGGHYSPHNRDHGAPEDAERHMGDLGNLESDENGIARMDFIDPVIELTDRSGIIGRAVIVHLGEDDYVTQPTGDAGARAGCGVIGVAQN